MALIGTKKGTNTREYSGLLCKHRYGDASDILFLSSLDDPLVDELLWMSGKLVTVRYWITDVPCTRSDAIADLTRTLFGGAKARFGSRYSELTGYLWTDEDLNVGGHDLVEELKGSVGKWLILEVEWESK